MNAMNLTSHRALRLDFGVSCKEKWRKILQNLRFPNWKIYSSEAVYCFSLRTYCNNIGHFIKRDALAIFTRLNQRETHRPDVVAVFIPSRSCLRPHWVRNFAGSSHEPVWCHLWMSVLGILGIFRFSRGLGPLRVGDVAGSSHEPVWKKALSGCP